MHSKLWRGLLQETTLGQPDELDEEITMMKEMFSDMVNQIMENEINELDNDTIEAIMEYYMPVLTEKLRELPENPDKINSYSQIVQSQFPDGVESEKDHFMEIRSESLDDQLSLTEISTYFEDNKSVDQSQSYMANTDCQRAFFRS